jgi:hypothetical protein
VDDLLPSRLATRIPSGQMKAVLFKEASLLY